VAGRSLAFNARNANKVGRTEHWANREVLVAGSPLALA
jgi:hypothetical protein